MNGMTEAESIGSGSVASSFSSSGTPPSLGGGVGVLDGVALGSAVGVTTFGMRK
jgi:hypothetical protein